MVTIEKAKVAMSVAEAAAEAGVSEATIYSLGNRGELPGARLLGKRIVIHRETFESWLKNGKGGQPCGQTTIT
jgi:excisionase family DNA binding protein